MAANKQQASCAGLTRASITLRKTLSKKMDCRVKPGNDAGREIPRTKKAPEFSGAFVVELAEAQALVRIRIIKLSKLSSATCIQASDSLRNAARLACILPKCGFVCDRSA